MPISPNRIEAVFLAAVGCSEPGQRGAVLARECGDDTELRDRVEALLRAHDNPYELPQPRLAQLDISHSHWTAYEPGTVIAGRYCLLEEIGEGGMGSVWVARQIDPVRRQVAIKFIKPGMDSRRVLARFEAERQALALMDQPNVAKVFDGGLTDDARPFFVMEYVQGLPITEYCDRERLRIPERLALFIQVCRAVHHAHQKGIIHRDLKPSNVLVARDSDQAVPKVIDFGLAKAIHEPLTDETLSVPHGGPIMGTPKYMSPEQAQHNNVDIDTRTDVYSLGVILYELLTGTTPLDGARLKAAGLPEMLRLIKEVEPSWPSSRLRGSESLQAVAADRGTEPTQLRRAVQGDLDWIVMKAMEKERTRRYDSANDLARDLERYLRDESVAARPPSASYRIRKFTRRHRVALIATILVTATLVAGSVISTAMAIRATRAMRLAEAARADAEQRETEADQARAAEVQQREIAQRERNDADNRRIEAETRFRYMRYAIGDSLQAMRKNNRLNVPELQSLRRELLEVWVEHYRRFAEQHVDDPTLRADMAVTHMWIADAYIENSDKDKAIEAFKQAVNCYEQLIQDEPGSLKFRAEAALAYSQLGVLQQGRGTLVDAAASFRRALEIQEKLARERPQHRDYQIDLASIHTRLSSSQSNSQRFAEAEDSVRRALEICQEVATQAPTDQGCRIRLAEAHYVMGVLARKTGRLDQAEASHTRASQIHEGLAREFPADMSHRASLAGAVNQLGHVQRITGRVDAARESYTRALDLYETLAREDPSHALFRRHIGSAHFHLGVLEAIDGQSDAAIQLWTTALADFNVAAELGFKSTGLMGSKAEALAMLGRWREAADAFAPTLDATGENHECRYQLALLHWAGGDSNRYRAACRELVARRGGDATGAEAGAIVITCLVDQVAVDNWNDVLAIARRAAASDPSNPVYPVLVGSVQFRAGLLDDARRSLEQSLPQIESADSSPSPPVDPVSAGRLLGETILLILYRERNDEAALSRQVSTVTDLAGRLSATVPFYCDEGDSWMSAFAVMFAQRELAGLRAAINR